MSLSPEAFTQRQILKFFWPLAASWLLMSAEGPILQAAIARLPEMQTQLAAFGIVTSLEIAIESPVIMLLATSTALTTSARNYLTLRRFMIWLNSWVTLVAVVFAFTPVFDLVVSGLMGIPQPIAEASRPGMKIMTLWSAAIGIRRFYQGVLIRRGATRSVGYGTLLRLISSGGTGVLLAIFTSLPGVYIGSIGLMAGVLVEVFFIWRVVQPTVASVLSSPDVPEGEALSMSDVVRYHAPLAATSLLTLLAQPMIGAGLARMPNALENLAVWPVVWSILFLFRSAPMALPEAVIALASGSAKTERVRAFCGRVGIAASLGLALMVGTPLLPLYLRYFAGLPERLARFVIPGLLLGIIVPLTNSSHSWFRGLLMSARRTHIIYWGMGINLVVTGAVVFLGIILRGHGIMVGIAALWLALLVEIAYLHRQLRSGIYDPKPMVVR